ncbi:hypothetical protein TNCV_4416261 [Trichonephila clavipes]|uniref:Uncharacterized protein n=1 Tax=Trichonephila clavipes TaxID=2585209 RepID=A0A8X6S190_TRICX|nr:hypothetical protein TNCV_4416261 [Trichonephila clavipes]
MVHDSLCVRLSISPPFLFGVPKNSSSRTFTEDSLNVELLSNVSANGNGPRHSERRSSDENDTSAAPLS